jgi:hypothetical protein
VSENGAESLKLLERGASLTMNGPLGPVHESEIRRSGGTDFGKPNNRNSRFNPSIMKRKAANSTLTRQWKLLFVHLVRPCKEGRKKRENIKFG